MLKVGDTVFCPWPNGVYVEATVIEDRGCLGVNGGQVVRIEIPANEAACTDAMNFEMSADDLKKLVADAVFAIGKTHVVCQDYAFSDGETVSLSDGCSSSPDTDFGARFLCRMWSQALRLDFPWLPSGAFDATLLTATVLGNSFYVQAWGDGVVIARRRDGSWIANVIEFPSGAPLYASYGVDQRRLDRYCAEFGTEKRLITHWSATVKSEMPIPALTKTGGIQPYETLYPIAEYDLVLLASDGVLSFQKPNGSATSRSFIDVGLPEIVAELLPRDLNGEFLKRRIKRFLAEKAKLGWHHNDDVAFAAVGIK